MNLLRSRVVGRALAVTQDHVENQPLHDNEDDNRHCQLNVVQAGDQGGLLRGRIKKPRRVVGKRQRWKEYTREETPYDNGH